MMNLSGLGVRALNEREMSWDFCKDLDEPKHAKIPSSTICLSPVDHQHPPQIFVSFCIHHKASC
jgi:hypothetical protein